jgi:protein-S-isoprenylcysteine O-methyltransferase Ste14
VNKAFGWVDILFYLFLLVLVVLAVRYGPRGPMWYVGLCLCIVATALWVIARWQLGHSFSVRPEARHLVTTGLYSRIRHPIYVFGSLAFFGALLALLEGQAVIIWLVIVMIEFARARREERALAEAFGDEYTAYRNRTWF